MFVTLFFFFDTAIYENADILLASCRCCLMDGCLVPLSSLTAPRQWMVSCVWMHPLMTTVATSLIHPMPLYLRLVGRINNLVCQDQKHFDLKFFSSAPGVQ